MSRPRGAAAAQHHRGTTNETPPAKSTPGVIDVTVWRSGVGTVKPRETPNPMMMKGPVREVIT